MSDAEKDVPAVVWVDPGRMGGQPCIYGTRITTRQVARMVTDYGIKYVREGWPYLTDQQIEGACWFERTHGTRPTPPAPTEEGTDDRA